MFFTNYKNNFVNIIIYPFYNTIKIRNKKFKKKQESKILKLLHCE